MAEDRREERCLSAGIDSAPIHLSRQEMMSKDVLLRSGKTSLNGKAHAFGKGQALAAMNAEKK